LTTLKRQSTLNDYEALNDSKKTVSMEILVS